MGRGTEVGQLDLTGDPAPLGELDRVRQEAYDPSPERERMRGWIALVLLAILALIVVVSLLTVALGLAPTEDLVRVLGLLFAPIVGLVGAATGFYFGSRKE